MSDETQGTASLPAEGATTADQTAETGAEQQVTEGQAQEGEQQAEQAGEKPEGEQQERKRLSGAQKAKRRETFLLNQLAEATRRAEEAERKAQPSTQQDDDKPPKEEDYKDWGEYIAEKAAYKIRQDRKAEVKAENERKATADQAGVWRERFADHQERIEELKETVKDFDQVIKSAAGITIREELGAEIVSSEKSALLQYHLAKNPDKLRELNSMTGRELAKEIGRLEATLTLPTAKTQTTARPPLSRLAGGAGPAIDLSKADMEAYVAERKKQGFGRR